MLARTVGVLGIAALLLACSDPDKAALSPFFLWGMRPGMQLDSVEQFLLRQDNVPWGKCEDLGSGVRRCERHTSWIWGRLEALAGPDGRVLYLSFAPDKSEYGTGRDLIFDKELSVMQQQWARTRKVRMDPHGKALMTFDGRLCTGTSRPCPALIQLLDWRATQNYAVMTVPPYP